MQQWTRLVAGSLLVTAFVALPSSGQLAPLVPLGDSAAEEPFLPAGISRSEPEMFGDYVHLWSLDDGTQIIQYYGDFALHLGNRRLRSRDAVVWMRKTVWKELTYYHFQVFLSQEASVRDAAGTVSSGPTLFVTFNSFEQADVEADATTTEPSADTTLYREALRVGDMVMSQRPLEGEPAEMAVIDLERERPEKGPQARPIVRFRAKEWKIDEQSGTVVATGDVYLSQGLVDSTTVMEIRAEAAVLFLAQREKEKSRETDPLAAEPPSVEGDPVAPLPGTDESAEEAALGSLGDVGSAISGAYLKGDVILTRGDRMIRASELYYDFENSRALILDAVMRATVPGRNLPIYVRAEQVRQLSNTEYMARKARVSMSEFHTPHVHIGAERIYLADATPRDETGRIVGLEAGRYRMNDVTFNVEGVPITYWPFAAGDFRRGETALQNMRFAYSDDFGATVESKWYLYNLLGLEEPEGVEAILRHDYYGERGPGVGIDLDYETEHSYGLVRGYYIHDNGEDNLGSFRDGTVDHANRGRFLVRHREFLPKGWELTLEGSYISDANFLEEYFNTEFEEDKEQETLIYLKKQQDNWAFTALAQWRVLDFLTQTEHLPDTGFHWIGQPLGQIASLYSESHLGFVRLRPDNRYFFDDNRIRDSVQKTDITVRADTRNEIDVPIKLGSTSIVPYAMGRTGYWDGSPSGDGAIGRLFGGLGVRAGTQFWQLFENVVSKMLDLNGIRHIIKPEITSWASATNYDSLDLYAFDPGIEDIDDFYGSSLALRQRWQTKRGGPGNWRVVDWITLDVELNLFGNTPRYEDPIGRFYSSRPENSNARNHVRTDFMYRLSDTTSVLADGNFDLTDGDLDLFNLSYAVERTPRFAYIVGYRRIGDTESNLLALGANYEINTKHRVAVRTYYDLERGQTDTFDITLVRKFPRWYAALTFGVDNIEEDFDLGLSVWPEGAPQMALGSRKYTGLAQSTGIRPED